MSYTEIYAFGKNGNAYSYGTVKNSWLGAMTIWDYMEKEYLPPYIPNSIREAKWFNPEMSYEEIVSRNGFAPSRLMPTGKQTQEIWDLVDNLNVPEDDRIVLFTTLDNCLVRRDNLPRVIAAFKQFKGESNFSKQVEILEAAYADSDIIAVGWYQSLSVGDCWGDRGGLDKETWESIPYNCLTGTDHYWLFDELTHVEEENNETAC